MSEEAFAPLDGVNPKVTVAASSGRVKVCEGNPGSYIPLLVTNLGTAAAWMRAGDATVTATTSDLPIGAGVVQVLRFKVPTGGVLYMAAIAAGSTGDIYFTPGDGI